MKTKSLESKKTNKRRNNAWTNDKEDMFYDVIELDFTIYELNFIGFKSIFVKTRKGNTTSARVQSDPTLNKQKNEMYYNIIELSK